MKTYNMKKKHSSVFIAKTRLHTLLASDRTQCTPDLVSQLKDDIYHAISKYLDVSPEYFEIKLTRSDIHIQYTGEK